MPNFSGLVNFLIDHSANGLETGGVDFDLRHEALIELLFDSFYSGFGLLDMILF